MLSFERHAVIEPGRISEARRISIGAQVLSIEFMRRISQYIRNFNATYERGLVFSDNVDTLAQQVTHLLDDKEYALSRDNLVGAEPNSLLHIAHQHMGHTTKSIEIDGELAFLVNGDFVVATHYLETSTYAQKLDAEIGIREAIESDYDSMVAFYTDKAITSIEANQQQTNLREIVITTTNDIAYWLKN